MRVASIDSVDRPHAAPYYFTWAFALRDEPGETTQLLVRERCDYERSWARPLVELAEAISFVMSQKMLRGIKDRAERPRHGVPAAEPAVGM